MYLPRRSDKLPSASSGQAAQAQGVNDAPVTHRQALRQARGRQHKLGLTGLLHPISILSLSKDAPDLATEDLGGVRHGHGMDILVAYARLA